MPFKKISELVCYASSYIIVRAFMSYPNAIDFKNLSKNLVKSFLNKDDF